MLNPRQPIPNVVIKQIFMLVVIVLLSGVILWNLSMFLPAVLGALTLYILCRKFNLYLLEKLKLKPWLAASFIILATVILLLVPIYFLVDIVVSKVDNVQVYVSNLSVFLDKIHTYLKSEFSIEILSKENMNQVQNWVTKFSASIVSGTVNIFTIVASMYFILYFMLINPIWFEKTLTEIAPLKKTNIRRIGDKIVKMVIANAVGIPVVALGQAIIALVGYYIFGAPSPMLLFALTFFTAMIPIVGAAIVYVPIGIYMLASGDQNGIWIIVYCVAIVGLTDNILRFTLLKKLENIHPLNTVFGIILGLELFGFMGLVFGPILVSITILLIQVYLNEFGTNDSNIEWLKNNDLDSL